MKYLDAFLNNLTMYRLVMWGLAVLAGVAVVFGFLGLVGFSGMSLLVSFFLLLAVCFCAEEVLSRLYARPKNVESAYITAMILFFVFAPVLTLSDAWVLAAAGVLAIASKYILAIRKKHIFNPAAFAAGAFTLAGVGASIWWVGTPVLLLPVAVLGLLVVRKLRRFDLFLSFLLVSTIVEVGYDLYAAIPIVDALLQSVLSWPLVFFATIMLTEPSTTPHSRRLRVVYGTLVGVLFSSHLHAWGVYITPELALIVGNLFSYAVNSKQKLLLRFKSKKQLSANVYEFAFAPNQKLNFKPGQYLEWTLPHTSPDTRGNRRYFTVASSPRDPLLRLGVRMGQNSSSFKKALAGLSEGSMAAAGNLGGDFVLPTNDKTKLVFIAGGVGITPFASMVRDLLERGEKRDVVILYAVSSNDDIAYQELLEEAKTKLGVKVVYVVKEFITEATIRAEVPDFLERTFYLSGPNIMVQTYRTLLRALALPWRQIKTDYFPGY